MLFKGAASRVKMPLWNFQDANAIILSNKLNRARAEGHAPFYPVHEKTKYIKRSDVLRRYKTEW